MGTTEMNAGLNAALASNQPYDIDGDGSTDIDLSDGLNDSEKVKIMETYGVTDSAINTWEDSNSYTDWNKNIMPYIPTETHTAPEPIVTHAAPIPYDPYYTLGLEANETFGVNEHGSEWSKNYDWTTEEGRDNWNEWSKDNLWIDNNGELKWSDDLSAAANHIGMSAEDYANNLKTTLESFGYEVTNQGPSVDPMQFEFDLSKTSVIPAGTTLNWWTDANVDDDLKQELVDSGLVTSDGKVASNVNQVTGKISIDGKSYEVSLYFDDTGNAVMGGDFDNDGKISASELYAVKITESGSLELYDKANGTLLGECAKIDVNGNIYSGTISSVGYL